MEIDIRNLEESVILFYRSEATQQAAAHDWLTQVQCSPQAWMFAWELMQPGKPCEVQFFGATTLHSKLMKYWHEVPKEMHAELKQKLLETIVTFGSGPKLVLDRLCISLSAFIVHMLHEWTTAIQDIVNIFQNQQLPNLTPNTQIWIMMEILGGIPEEANAIYTSVARVSLRNQINRHAEFVINTINQYVTVKSEQNLTSDEMTTILRAVRCAGAWFKNGGLPLDNCTFIVTSMLKLINTSYWNNLECDGCMTAEANELADASLETLHAIMIQPDANRYPNSALVLMKMFLDSLANITKAEWKENNLNEDIAVGIYNLLISSIECHSKLLLDGLATQSDDHKELYIRLINIVLECTDKPGIYPVEESCSTIAMGFWYMLQDEVLSMDQTEHKQLYIDLIRPLYTHLTRILVRKSQQPDEIALERWNFDDLEAFRCYRQDISDTLIYCYDVLNDSILEILDNMFQKSITFIGTDENEWPKLEASIYSFYAIAEHIDTTERTTIPRFMEILCSMPYKKWNTKVLGTALETIGAYSEWFKDNPAFIKNAIQLLVMGLDSPKAAQATLGLKDLTRECQSQMKEYAEPLLDACQQLLSANELKSAESIRLMYSVGKLMSLLPPEKITICLDTMISPYFNEMYMMAESGTITESYKIRVLYCLKMIATLFSSLNTTSAADQSSTAHTSSNQMQVQQIPQEPGAQATQQQPLLFVLQKTMPILKKIGEIYINENNVIEALCSALKYSITNLMDDFMPMLPDLTFLILNIIQTKCCPQVMEISRTCITTFHREERYRITMQELFYGIINAVFKQFEQTPEANFSDIADIVEEFFSFNALIVKKTPSIYVETNIDCVKLVGYATKAMTLPENGPIKYGSQFLSHFIMQSRGYPVMTQTILENGDHIIRTTLMCIGELTPRQQVDYFADIFLAVNKKYPSELIVWLNILKTPSFPTAHTTAEEKRNFMKAIIKEKVNKRLIQGQIREFSAKSRGLVEKV